MKRLFTTILILILLAFPILGANTHSIDLEANSAQHLSIPDATQEELDLAGDFTLETWVKFESIDNPKSDNPVILGRWAVDEYAWYFQYSEDYVDPDGFRLGISDDGVGANVEYLEKAWVPNTATWYHIAVTFDASESTAEFFVDTSSIGTDTGTITSIFDGAATLYVGAYLGTGNLFDGLFDDMRVWRDIRTDQEIIDNYDCQIVGDEDDLVAYWKFNNSPSDETIYGNNLTPVNSPTYSADVNFVGECAVPAAVGVPSQSPIEFQ